MKYNKKDILGIIFYTVALVFFFIYIKEILGIIGLVVKWFMPFIIGLGIAFVLNVLVNVIEKKWLKKWKNEGNAKRAVSLSIALSIVIGAFALLLLLIIPNIQETIVLFAENLPSYNITLKEFLEKIKIDPSIISEIGEIIKNLGDTLSDYIKNNSNQVIETTIGVASNVITGIINLTIGLVFAIYYLAQKEKITNQVEKIMSAYLPDKVSNKIKDIGILANQTFARFISGQCLEAVIIGVLCFIGMLLLKLPFASAISVLVGFTALIPVFGAFLGTIVGAFLIFMVSPVKSIIFVMFIIILQQFEGNLIYPKVVGKSMGIPGIWVFVAVTVGASIGGVMGMLLSVPLVSILYSILATNVKYRLNEK